MPATAIPDLLPSQLDAAQRSRLLRVPSCNLLFASFDPDTAHGPSNVPNLSPSSDRCAPKRIVLEVMPGGKILWRYVPKARSEEGVIGEGVWPRTVVICGQHVECSQDLWDMYKLDPMFDCFVRASPKLTQITRVSSHATELHSLGLTDNNPFSKPSLLSPSEVSSGVSDASNLVEENSVSPAPVTLSGSSLLVRALVRLKGLFHRQQESIPVPKGVDRFSELQSDKETTTSYIHKRKDFDFDFGPLSITQDRKTHVYNVNPDNESKRARTSSSLDASKKLRLKKEKRLRLKSERRRLEEDLRKQAKDMRAMEDLIEEVRCALASGAFDYEIQGDTHKRRASVLPLSVIQDRKAHAYQSNPRNEGKRSRTMSPLDALVELRLKKEKRMRLKMERRRLEEDLRRQARDLRMIEGLIEDVRRAVESGAFDYEMQGGTHKRKVFNLPLSVIQDRRTHIYQPNPRNEGKRSRTMSPLDTLVELRLRKEKRVRLKMERRRLEEDLRRQARDLRMIEGLIEDVRRAVESGAFDYEMQGGTHKRKVFNLPLSVIQDRRTHIYQPNPRNEGKRSRTMSPLDTLVELRLRKEKRVRLKMERRRLEEDLRRRARDLRMIEDLIEEVRRPPGAPDDYPEMRDSLGNGRAPDSHPVGCPDADSNLDAQRARLASILESRRKMAELEKDRPLWEEQARKREVLKQLKEMQARRQQNTEQFPSESRARDEQKSPREDELLEEQARRKRIMQQRKLRWSIGPWTIGRALERYQLLSKDFDTTHFSPSNPLTFEDAPWPTLHPPCTFTIQDIDWKTVENFFSEARLQMRPQIYKLFVQESHRRFHPDRWRARRLLKSVPDDATRHLLEAGATTVAQALTPIWRTVVEA